MRTLYLDCSMGAAGDMLAAALLELLPNGQGFAEQMNALGIPGVRVRGEKSVKCGICGTHFSVEVQGKEEHEETPESHSHGSMEDIRGIVASMPIPTMVKLDVLAVYELLAQAESAVHGVPVEYIHFHEVGAMDAVADITAVCLLMHKLKPEKVVASPVHVGSGTVGCAHGVLPVPAPATARLLLGIPTYSQDIAGELCTPTGAALLKYFAAEFGPQPPMTVEAIGYGMGKKDFPRANCLRAMLGTGSQTQEQILELKCNLDDMTGEAVGFALEALMEHGALDAFTTPIGMKKSRPGVLLTVLCRPEQREELTRLLFRYTTTLGVRETACRRNALHRREEQVDTPYGPVRKKISYGCGVCREKYEYEDLARIARELGVGIKDVKLSEEAE